MLTTDTKFCAINPDQGNAKDCFFLAALSSFLWMKSITVPFVNGRYEFNFYQDSNPEPITVKSMPHIPMYLNQPYFARSNRANEFWPALYEKAWALFKQNNPNDVLPHPNMDVILNNFGNNAGTVLSELTGKKVWFSWVQNMTDVQFTQLLNNGRKTKYETVAWTYESGDQYDSTNIVANHSYSVLGGMTTAQGLHVILRNPYGHKTTEDDPRIAGYLGLWDYQNDVNLPTHQINLPQVDGMFGVDFQTFKTYFKMIGYTNNVQVIPENNPNP
jgi:hypothetical protein